MTKKTFIERSTDRKSEANQMRERVVGMRAQVMYAPVEELTPRQYQIRKNREARKAANNDR